MCNILSLSILKRMRKAVRERTLRRWPNDHLIRRLVSSGEWKNEPPNLQGDLGPGTAQPWWLHFLEGTRYRVWQIPYRTIWGLHTEYTNHGGMASPT